MSGEKVLWYDLHAHDWRWWMGWKFLRAGGNRACDGSVRLLPLTARRRKKSLGLGSYSCIRKRS